MGAAKQLWMNEIERVGDQLADGSIDRMEAVDAWIRLGLDRDEAEDEAYATLDVPDTGLSRQVRWA